MGFKLPERTYVLHFEEGTYLDGAEIKFRATPVGALVKISQAKGFKDLAKFLPEYLISWNLEDAEGNPIPATEEGIIEHLEEAVLAAIVHEWVMAAKGVTAPLNPAS
jgi:hypothetical protein